MYHTGNKEPPIGWDSRPDSRTIDFLHGLFHQARSFARTMLASVCSVEPSEAASTEALKKASEVDSYYSVLR